MAITVQVSCVYVQVLLKIWDVVFVFVFVNFRMNCEQSLGRTHVFIRQHAAVFCGALGWTLLSQSSSIPVCLYYCTIPVLYRTLNLATYSSIFLNLIIDVKYMLRTAGQNFKTLHTETRTRQSSPGQTSLCIIVVTARFLSPLEISTGLRCIQYE